MKFVIEFEDPVTECVSSEFAFETTNVEGLSDIVNPGAGGFRPSRIYGLTESHLDRIEGLLGINIERASGIPALRFWGKIDDLPYKVHTNRELALMLKGQKPLSVFVGSHPPDPQYDCIPEHLFAPYVEAGLFSASEHIVAHPHRGKMRFVMYAAKNEEWRIQAFVLLQKTIAHSGWSKGFTRLEGSLLGYEDWENDIFIETFFKEGDAGN